MKNNQLFPFERNRYYAGKALTATDFFAEQQYFNNKRRFINNIVFGSGIVCGLSVFNLDDLSFLLESGVAIDGQGREIVVEKSVVHKLSSVEGFEELKTDKAVLCIRYKEEDVHPVYCAGNGEDEYQCNRIEESYELFLKDKEEDALFIVEEDYLIKEEIADTQDYTVSISIPSIVAKKRKVKLHVCIKKKTDAENKLTLKGVLQIPVLNTVEQTHELEINIADVQLKKEAVFEKDYWLYVDNTELDEVSIISKNDTFKLLIDEKETAVNSDLSINLRLVNLTPDEIASQELGKFSLEMRSMGMDVSAVPLAEISLMKTEMTSLIQNVLDKEVKNYIMTPAQMHRRIEFLSYFAIAEEEKAEKEKVQKNPRVKVAQERYDSLSNIASGTLEIPLKPNMKEGDILISDEIMHGLGKGNVYVDIGLVKIEEDIHLNTSSSTTIYGNADLFHEEGQMEVETAVKVFKDKGSFQIAAKLLGEQTSIVLLVEWVAIKFATPDELKMIEDVEGKRIVAKTPTVRMAAKTTYFFEVEFENMDICGLSYELTEEGSGEISSDGIYTAPAKEGVYEIHIYCTENPKISTYVYAIVNK